MPFTISHTAVVLPFSRWLARWQLLSAATIGAMVPDFRMFFPGVPRVETHSLTALFTFCLPVGLVTYWVFQRVIKSPILEVLPEGPYARWRPFAAEADIRSIRQWLLAGVGVLGGALTHLVWDAFTHEAAGVCACSPCSTIRSSTLAASIFRRCTCCRTGFAAGTRCGARNALLWPAPWTQTAVPNRLVRTRERLVWCVIYALAAGTFTAAFYIWVRLGQPPTRSIVLRASGTALPASRPCDGAAMHQRGARPGCAQLHHRCAIFEHRSALRTRQRTCYPSAGAGGRCLRPDTRGRCCRRGRRFASRSRLGRGTHCGRLTNRVDPRPSLRPRRRRAS